MRQDPRKLYAAYGFSSDMKAHDGRPMPSFDQLGPKVTAHWTITALAACGFDMSRSDPAFDAIAKTLLEDGKVPPAAEALYWQVRTASRLSAAVAESKIPLGSNHPTAREGWQNPITGIGSNKPPFVFATGPALAVALAKLAMEKVDALLGPMLHPGEAERAEDFLRQLGVLSIASMGLRATHAVAGPNPGAHARVVSTTFARIAERFELLELDGRQPVEVRLYRNAARLILDLAALEGA